LIEPLAERCSVVYLKPPTQFEWIEWMSKKGWVYGPVFAFLNFRPGLMFRKDPGARVFPCPRAWTDTVRIILANPGLTSEMEELVVASNVGIGAALEYSAFREVYSGIPRWEDVLQGKVQWQEDKKWAIAVITAIALNCPPSMARNFIKFSQTIPPEMAVLLYRTAMANKPLVETLQAGEIGQEYYAFYRKHLAKYFVGG
jgi:hypothetical protein